MKFISPTTITDGLFVSSTAPEADYAAWVAATAYSIGNRVIRTSTHRIYERIVAGTTATAPESDTTNWLDIGPTNRWAMFDGTVGTVTSIATPLTVVVKPGVVNALAVLDVSASTVRVKMTDGLAGPTVFDTTYPMPDAAEIVDWYGYWFEPIQPKTDLIVENLPPYANGHITVTFSASATASCGTFAVGKVVELGLTRSGVSVGIIDYSRRETDQWGVTSVVQRSYSKRFDTPVIVDNKRLDYVAKQLAAVRSKPCVWVASDTYSSLIIYGFYKDWSNEINYPNISEMRLSVEGLT